MRQKIPQCIALLSILILVVSCTKRQVEKIQPSQNLAPLEKSYFFIGKFDQAEKIVQYSQEKSTTRTLLPFDDNGKNAAYRYLIREELEGTLIKEAYLVSRKALTSLNKLHEINFNHNEVAYFTEISPKGERPFVKSRIKFKVQGSGIGYQNIENSPVVSRDPPEECVGGGNIICIDWYWIDYNPFTGEIYDYYFLYRDCYDCEEGGSNPGPTAEEEVLLHLTSMIDKSYVTNEKVSVQIIALSSPPDPTWRKKEYIWQIFKVSDGDVWPATYISKEHGEQVWEETPGGDYWKFTSFNHIDVVLEGYILGYSISTSAVTATGSFLTHTYYHDKAKMHLSTSVTISVSALGRTFSSSKSVSTSQEWRNHELTIP